MTLYSSGMFLLLFLPLAAVLIGSGGFYTELKDNAWIYLFSRPIKKERIWMYKYVSQLSILAAIFVVFYFVRRVLPGFDKIIRDLDIGYPAIFGFQFTLSVYVVFPIIAFTVAFSLSFLHDKQFIVFLVSILIGTAFLFISQVYTYFLWDLGFFGKGEGILALFFAFSFVLASILTLVKADFSQTKKKIVRFSAYVLIFLIFSLFFSTVLATRGQIFIPRRDLSVWFNQEFQGNLYFHDYRKGILRYHSEQEQIQRVNKESRFSPEFFSLQEGKIAFLQIQSRRQWHHDLWIMNADGTEARPLIESSNEDSPFYLKGVESFILSLDAQKVAFVTSHQGERQSGRRNMIHTLWWMNTDGAGLKSQILDVPYGHEARLIAWPRLKQKLVLEIRRRAIFRDDAKIVMIDLISGTKDVLAEGVLSPSSWHPSPDQDYLTLTVRNALEENDRFILQNLNTLETIELFSKEVIGVETVKWSPDGHQIVFFQPRDEWFRDRALRCYDLEKKIFTKIYQQGPRHGIRYDWTSGGLKFLILDSIDEENSLIVMNSDFEVEKTVDIPEDIKGAHRIWGLENRALLQGSRKSGFWRVDLETEEWKKVY
jgi:hypothetical protein